MKRKVRFHLVRSLGVEESFLDLEVDLSEDRKVFLDDLDPFGDTFDWWLENNDVEDLHWKLIISTSPAEIKGWEFVEDEPPPLPILHRSEKSTKVLKKKRKRKE